jgi:DNA-directed RNA polymerase specialized sigma24 family protein
LKPTVPAMPKIEYAYSPRRPPTLRFDTTRDADKLPELLAEASRRNLTEDDHADNEAWQRPDAFYSPLLRDWLRSHAFPQYDQDDLVQDILHTVALEMPGFQYDREKGGFRAWLRTVLIHRLRNYWRQQRSRSLATAADNFITGVLDHLEDPRSSLAQVWDREHDQRYVYVHPGHYRRLPSRGAVESFTNRSLGLHHVPRNLRRCVGPLRAEGFAKVALERSLAPDCRFDWGDTAAGHLLGQTLIAQKS